MALDSHSVSLAVAPGSGTVYAAINGLLRSTDGGKTWKKVLDRLTKQVVVDPSSPRTVYGVSASGYYTGLFKSTDGGDTWAQVGHEVVWAVAVAPSGGTLYAAAGYSSPGYFVSRSSDGGASWTEGGDSVPLREIKTLAVDPETPMTVYVGGSYGIAGPGGRSSPL